MARSQNAVAVPHLQELTRPVGLAAADSDDREGRLARRLRQHLHAKAKVESSADPRVPGRLGAREDDVVAREDGDEHLGWQQQHRCAANVGALRGRGEGQGWPNNSTSENHTVRSMPHTGTLTVEYGLWPMIPEIRKFIYTSRHAGRH
eukprot:2143404-Prymnesium_polylepis.1